MTNDAGKRTCPFCERTVDTGTQRKVWKYMLHLEDHAED